MCKSFSGLTLLGLSALLISAPSARADIALTFDTGSVLNNLEDPAGNAGATLFGSTAIKLWGNGTCINAADCGTLDFDWSGFYSSSEGAVLPVQVFFTIYNRSEFSGAFNWSLSSSTLELSDPRLTSGSIEIGGSSSANIVSSRGITALFGPLDSGLWDIHLTVEGLDGRDFDVEVPNHSIDLGVIPSAVPEPGTNLLIGGGAVAFGLLRLRKRTRG